VIGAASDYQASECVCLSVRLVQTKSAKASGSEQGKPQKQPKRARVRE
jgi:hypothetical protein